jgi:hypothetical protein
MDNRKEAKEDMYAYSKESHTIPFDRLEDFIDDIYDNFENRVCATCNLFYDNMCNEPKLFENLIELPYDEFKYGCNLWIQR